MHLNKKKLVPHIRFHSIALMTGYIAWLSIYTCIPIKKTYQTPVTFFNFNQEDTLEAPEVVDVTLLSSRALLDRINPTLYINAETIPYNRPSFYHIQDKDLFVPNTISVVHYYPSVISIKKNKVSS